MHVHWINGEGYDKWQNLRLPIYKEVSFKCYIPTCCWELLPLGGEALVLHMNIMLEGLRLDSSWKVLA